jgi:hypothetical protein
MYICDFLVYMRQDLHLHLTCTLPLHLQLRIWIMCIVFGISSP